MNEPRNISQAIGNIIVMEESDSIRKLIEKILTQKGFDVVCAKDGAEAIEFYQSAQALQEPFDAVILDLTVTGGMGAKETIKQLVKIDPDVKGIVTTGDTFNDAVCNYQEYGFCGALTKPFDHDELISLVYKMI